MHSVRGSSSVQSGQVINPRERERERAILDDD